jgi:hypothetical protein
MAYRPDSVVDVIGHTDPIGSDADNHTLGGARANAVKTALTDQGVDAGRVHADSMGEKALLTRNPRDYARNRRADFGWATGSSPGGGGTQPTDEDRATQRAMAKAQSHADPADVTRYVPRPVEERGLPAANAPLPEWHWGKLDPTFRRACDDWIRTEVGTKLETALDGVPQLDTVTETVPITGTRITVNPRDRAKEIVRALMAAPTAELGALMGETAGP